MPQNNNQALIDIPTACQILSLSKTTIYKLLRQGDLKTVRIGRTRRITQNQISQYIQKLEALAG